MRVHRHAKPLNQVESQWSVLNPESAADAPPTGSPPPGRDQLCLTGQ